MTRHHRLRGYDAIHLTAALTVSDRLYTWELRPLTFVASVAGAAVWIVSLPFTLLAGNTSEAGDVLVLDPFCYTFKRPLGHMEESTPIKQY